MPNRAPHGTLHLYEIVNYDRRESVIALVEEGFAHLLIRLKSSRPPELAHWGSNEQFFVELIAAAVPGDRADKLLEQLRDGVPWQGWKRLVWRG